MFAYNDKFKQFFVIKHNYKHLGIKKHGSNFGKFPETLQDQLYFGILPSNHTLFYTF